jgi:hypothetical protein
MMAAPSAVPAASTGTTHRTREVERSDEESTAPDDAVACTSSMEGGHRNLREPLAAILLEASDQQSSDGCRLYHSAAQ